MTSRPKFKLPEKLVLDVSKWRCGGDSASRKTALGSGSTYLLCPSGRMCCLGQFSLQSGVPKEELMKIGEPRGIRYEVAGLTTRIHLVSGMTLDNSAFSSRAMRINDDDYSPILAKVAALKSLCEEYGHKLSVRNLKKLMKGNSGVQPSRRRVLQKT